MAILKYKVISSKAQYWEYSHVLETLVFSGAKDRAVKDEIDLLTLLIEKWDEQHNTFQDLDPVQLIRSLMTEHGLKAKDMVSILEVGKGYVSDILNYKKGLSKEVIRKLASHFKVSQESFNRPYQLVSSENVPLHNTNAQNRSKRFARA